MIFRTPAYYKKFKCIASACSDNCCIGWEIDIDRISRARYEGVSGSFGERLRRGMTEAPEGSCSFCLSEGRRCVFLNRENLCDIILELGEGALCQICRDHPRYFEWFDDGTKEGGIGLCCEEAARIILTCEEPFTVWEREIPEEEEDVESEEGTDEAPGDPEEYSDEENCDPEEENIYPYSVEAFRDECLAILDSGIPVKEALIRILEKACKAQEECDERIAELSGDVAPAPALRAEQMRDCVEDPSVKKRILGGFLTLLSGSEPMDPSWPEYLNGVRERLLDDIGFSGGESSKEIVKDLYLKNVAQYFLWRYTRKGEFQEDGFFLPYVVTPVWLTLLVEAMIGDHVKGGGAAELSDCIQIVKAFSKEVEYDEDLFDLILQESCGIVGENA